MKTTGELTVTTDFKLKNEIIIHPNDGFDLELMNFKYPVTISTILTEEKENFAGEISLSNDCKCQTIILGTTFWKKIGKLNKIKLSISDDKKIIFVGK